MARWGLNYIEGEREPATASTELGQAVHKELEDWVSSAKMPKNRIALAALPYAPTPGSAFVERAIRFRTESSPWRGYIDVQTVDGIAKVESLAQLDGAVASTIQDWKTTSSIQWALDEAGLLGDIQANLYAYETFVEQRVRTVRGRWVYLPTKGACRPKVVEVKFDRNRTLDFVDGVLDPKASELQRLYQLRPKWTDLPKDTSKCFAYGKRCPGYERCNPTSNKNLLHGDEYMDFKDAMAAKFPGLPPVPPPPLPAIPAAPALVAPPAPPVPEAGFVNPPEAPRVAAKSPEHAVQLQAVVPPAPPAPVDELDGLTRDQLKALAVLEGAEPENTRKREQALRESIRDWRSKWGSYKDAAPSVPDTIVPPAPTTKSVIELHIEEDQKNGDWGEDDVMVPPVPDALPAEAIDTQNVTPGFVLYLGCAPLDGDFIHLSLLVSLANNQIQREYKVADYRLVEYGKGPGMLASIVADLLDREPHTHIVAELCPSTSVCMDILLARASKVVRSFS
jgi:hypothetical protein